MSASNQIAASDVLAGHISPETAYVVDDYPYGFRLRCKIRYWLEHDPKRGTRFWSQTTNPKRGDIWNKPKASTYCRFGGAMFLDSQGHVSWSGVNEYDSLKELVAWREKFGASLPTAPLALLDAWIGKKQDFERKKAAGLFTTTTVTIIDGGPESKKTEVLKSDYASDDPAMQPLQPL